MFAIHQALFSRPIAIAGLSWRVARTFPSRNQRFCWARTSPSSETRAERHVRPIDIVHRGGDLAYGSVCDSGIRCPYHGWTFDGNTGKCTGIPALADKTKFPPNAPAVRAYPTIERFAHVWTCLAEPMFSYHILLKSLISNSTGALPRRSPCRSDSWQRRKILMTWHTSRSCIRARWVMSVSWSTR